MEKDYKLTIDDVAEKFNVTRETVRRWCRERKIRFIKLPGIKGEYRFSKEDVNDFIAVLNSEPVEEVQNKETKNQ